MFRSYGRTNMFNRHCLLITFSCNKSELIIFNTRSMVIHSTEKVLQTSLYRFVAVYITQLLAFIPKPWQVWYLKKLPHRRLTVFWRPWRLLVSQRPDGELETRWWDRRTWQRRVPWTTWSVVRRSEDRGLRCEATR